MTELEFFKEELKKMSDKELRKEAIIIQSFLYRSHRFFWQSIEQRYWDTFIGFSILYENGCTVDPKLLMEDITTHYNHLQLLIEEKQRRHIP